MFRENVDLSLAIYLQFEIYSASRHGATWTKTRPYKNFAFLFAEFCAWAFRRDEGRVVGSSAEPRKGEVLIFPEMYWGRVAMSSMIRNCRCVKKTASQRAVIVVMYWLYFQGRSATDTQQICCNARIQMPVSYSSTSRKQIVWNEFWRSFFWQEVSLAYETYQSSYRTKKHH